ncbi:D-alanyl-D-alanine carboxypeptidase [Streptomyces sp. NPDC093568]|uniref:D-alanyl-D-alanine carboxypeptidase n=1 Tax=Streptomyces sp. NPDC093568 TaxID=3366041 RepID=UPI0037FF3389
MAGESPDRSKQRESSAEPTSGSAIPVPEPTKPPATDPRLAVARESESRKSVDTATKVLSRRELEAVRAELENAEDAGDTDGRDDAAAEAGDDRLKAAVAAWVASADTDEDAEDAEDAEGAQDGTDEPSEAPEAASDDGDSGEGTAADAAKTTEPADAPSIDAADSATNGTAENADAAEAEDAKAQDAEPEGAEPEDAEPQDAKPEGANSSGPDREDASGESADVDAEPQDAKPEDAEPQDAKPEGAEPQDAKPEGAKSSGPDREDASGESADVDAESDAEDAEPADSDESTAPDDGEDAPEGPPAADDESRTGGAGGNTKAEGEAEAKAVDQPTAVFKAVRPKKPHVDQPTTMLKAPKPEAPEAPEAPKAPAAPENPAERTSKFVALKPDIHQGGAPKPPTPAPMPPAPDVTAAVPQVGPERTTQQPLPPKPPLDLLAELTNTPPPPETPVRTVIRRIKIWTPLVILLVIVLGVIQSVRPLPAPTLDLTAKDEYTFEGGKIDIPWPTDGQAALDVDGIGSFGSSGEQKPVPIASVAKVMTAYVILREHPLDSGDKGPNIKIDQAAEDQSDAGQESTVKVTSGDEISQREALESILIASANNVARLLARWDSGSEKSFVAKMNAAADDLGMKNTTYTDPSGLNNTTVSTAVDQVKLAKAAMKFPAFREVAAMMSYDDYKGENHGNWNQLVGRNNVVGIKTGTTTSALGNLVFAAKKDVGGETRTVIGAVVRQPDAGAGILAAALDSGDQLIRAAQGALESATLLKKGDVVGYVDDGLGGRTAVVATKDVTAVGWSGLKVELTFAPDEVPHTAKAGAKVGTLTVGDGTSGAVKIPVALRTDLAEPGFLDKLTRIG